tara:strand:- start:3701 stop:5092 length:1392 start_codon:yes stop_codon:yes gene_type:complete
MIPINNIKKIIDKNEFYIFVTILILPIFIRFLTKINDIEILNIKYLVSILLSYIIVDFLIKTSHGIFSFLKYEFSKSLNFVLFHLLLFSVSSIAAILGINLNFSNQLCLFFLIGNILFFVNSKSLLLKVHQSFNIVAIFIINQFSNNFLYQRQELAGDIKRWQYPNIEKIFNNNVIDVLQNPIDDSGYFYINLLVLANFYFAVISKLILLNSFFVPLIFIPLTTFILGNYFIYETNLKRNTKFFLYIFNILVILINDWVRYLLVDSYMQEGVVSLFFAIIFFNFKKIINLKKNKQLFILFIISFFIFSKLFIGLFIFVLPLIFFKSIPIQKYINIYFFLSIGLCFLIRILFIYPKNNLNTFEKTIDFSNLYYIAQYWFEDLMFIFIICFSFALFIYNLFRRVESKNLGIETLTVSLLNLLIILVLYSTLWSSGEEYESSYRYFLQGYYLNLYFLGNLLNNLKS